MDDFAVTATSLYIGNSLNRFPTNLKQNEKTDSPKHTATDSL